MRFSYSLFVAAALFSPSNAVAETAPVPKPLPSEVRLSDAEREKILEDAAASRREKPLAQDIVASDNSPRPVQGEVGFELGTGGYRSAYGTAIVPFDDDGVAIISLGSTNFGKRGRYFDPWWH